MMKNQATKRVNTVQAKNDFNRLVSQVRQNHEPLIVEKRGQPVAVILDYESYLASAQKSPDRQNTSLVRDLKGWHDYLKTQQNDTTDSVEILRELRDERAKRYE